ncbi:MAG TPA: TonB-dependent receptor [Pyrinomonadaceae bacterium]
MSLLLLLCSSLAFAQTTSTTSSVTGIVTDPTGAVISGATVTLTDTKTSKEVTTTTDEQGVYRFSQVQPGQGFRLTFSGAGFQTLVINDVALGVGTAETHNAQLTAGQVTETVEVTASNEATLNTTDASIGNVIETRRLMDLPVQIRNSPAALIGLQPGVVGNNVGTTRGNAVGSVTGSRADQGNITVDGIDANDQTTQQFGATIGNAPIDSVQEFRAVTANPGASEGRSSGGQIQLITKSGTNEFHGSLREFNRTAATAANSFFNNRAGVARPQLTRNQFGGSIGGPVYFPKFGMGNGDAIWSGKDKLFFFFDYEGRRDAQGVSYLRIVPLQHYRQGGLAYLNNTAGCPTNARLNTRPECITILTPAQVAALDPRGIGPNQALLNLINERYPLPNDLTAGNGINTGGFRFNSPSHRTDNTYTTRIDWNATDRQRVFGRFNIARRLNTDTTNTVAQQFPTDPETGQIAIEDTTYVVGHNWVANANLVNDFRFGVSRGVARFPAPFAPAFPNIFGTPAAGTGGTFGGIGIAAPFADISYQDRTVPVPTIRDDVSWTRGSHNFQFGTQLKPIRQQSSLINDFNFVQLGLGGNLTALNATLRPGTLGAGTTRSANFDNAFAFLLGRYASISTNFNYDPAGNAFGPGTGKSRDYRYNEYEFYAADSWRMRNDLTITAGLRYHLYPAPYEANGFQATADVPYETLINTRIRNAALGIAGPSAEPFLSYDLAGAGNNGRPLYETDKNNFAPRLSFAYNPSFRGGVLGALFGDRKMVIRGGGSVVYDRVGGGITFIQDQVSYLFDNSATTNFGSTNARNSLLNDPRFTGLATLPVQNVAPEITRPFTPFVDNGFPFGNEGGQTNYVVDPNFKTPYSIQYSLGFQRELPANFIMELAYVGRQGRKLFTQADAAQVLNFRDPASGQFLFGAFNNLQDQINAGGAITAQPFLENQISAALGAPCAAVLGSSCTQFVADNLGDLVSLGDTADTIQVLQGAGFLRPNVGLSGQFSTNAYITNLGSSSYNGMLLSLRRRFSQGLQFDFNYSWSHAIDNQSSITNTVFGGLVCDVTNLRVCRGDADFDIRHLINVNGIWEIPVGRGKAFAGDAPGWLNAIIGGWQLSGIYTYRSGLPFSTTTGSFPVGFVFNSPAVFTGGNNAAAQGNIRDVGTSIQYFADAEAVLASNRNPRHGEIGNRNIFRGPSFWNVDTAVLKNFRLPWSETQRLQIRWESYNAFNHHSFGLPNANINSTTFGVITTSASTAREMQFGIRYDF